MPKLNSILHTCGDKQSLYNSIENLTNPHMQIETSKPACFAHLSSIVSDPPTVTAQRLKAIVSGCMPTFVDFSSSFQSEEIHEDNWISQFKKRNSSLVERICVFDGRRMY